MNIKSFLKRLFGGEVVEKIDSSINEEILVVKELSGRTIMRVGGIVQSGGMVEKIWEKALNEVQRYKGTKVQSVLVLGLGAGTAAEIINQKWPGIKITGVEVDPEVIKIGKKYFGLSKVPGLKIKIGDAIEKITNHQSLVTNHPFDLILVDLYLGQEFPKEAESEEFISGLKKILNENGLIIFNRLYFGKHKKETEKFLEELKGFFPKINSKRIEFNLFIFCRSFSRN